jgi:hypothetical protein
MNVVDELEALLTLDQAQGSADSDRRPSGNRALSTQQLLDELLGRFDDDDSTTAMAHGLASEFHFEFDEQ